MWFKLQSVMLKEERQEYILNEVSIRNRILLNDIAESLGVSVDTIRRDVKELDDQKKLRKVHGGAVTLGYTVLPAINQDVYGQQKKTEIAQKALSLLREGQVVLMSGGTTNLEFARLLPPKMQLTVITPSVPVAMQLLGHPSADVIFLGGMISKSARIAVGSKVIRELSEFRADICFIGTGYADLEHGLTEFDYEVVQVKKAMLQASKKKVLLSISDKLNSYQRFKTCDAQDLDVLVTELEPGADKLTPFRKLGITIV